MQIDLEMINKGVVAVPRRQSIDAIVVDEFKEKVRDLVKPEHELLVLDMTNVTFMDSSGLGALIAISKTMGKGQRMVLCNMVETVRNVISLTRLDQVFTILPTRQAALQLLEKRS